MLHSQIKGIYSKSFNVKLPQAGNKFVGKQIGVFGDSIPSGWDGYHFYLNTSYPDWVSKYLGTNKRVLNYAVPSAKIVGHRFATLERNELRRTYRLQSNTMRIKLKR
ncbi:hypothetical protein [Lentilactobacillus rapi]|uniref:hypothetical protein n=1 Tax=Lentilactobacillus rapi TaxID=481723 RepID=UPI000A81A5D5|nr:hypothetical protein [Lentilactobacillus rapi]